MHGGSVGAERMTGGDQLRSLLVRSMAAVRSHPTRLTPAGDLASLIERLHPRTTPANAPLIRLGPAGDGGYLVPDDLDGVDACFSPGVSDVAGFERACAERGMSVYLADASIDGPPELHESFEFVPKFVGSIDRDPFMTMDRWVDGSGVDPASELILQMDVEGYEYEAVLSMSTDLLERCRVIVIEFHGLHHLWSEPYFRLAGSAFEKLLDAHDCVHIHPNNYLAPVRIGDLEIPPLMEFTFARRDRLSGAQGYATSFPHPLDADNTSNDPLPLPRAWYR